MRAGSWEIITAGILGAMLGAAVALAIFGDYSLDKLSENSLVVTAARLKCPS